VTFARSARRQGHPLTGVTVHLDDDSGAEALRALGMSVREYERGALADIPGFATAEFYLNSAVAVTDAMTQLMEDTLRGSLYVSRRHGERDFGDFLRSEVPASILRRLDPRPPGQRLKRHRWLSHVRTLYSHLPLAAAVLDGLRSDRLHLLWRSTRLYQFHWGFAKLLARYE
jgi:hypothetical protein